MALDEFFKYVRENTAKPSSIPQGEIARNLWNGFNNNPQNTATKNSVVNMMTNSPVVGDLLSGLIGAGQIGKGLVNDISSINQPTAQDMVHKMSGSSYGEGALNMIGALPLVPALGGVIRTGNAKNLSLAQILQANKAGGKMIAKYAPTDMSYPSTNNIVSWDKANPELSKSMQDEVKSIWREMRKVHDQRLYGDITYNPFRIEKTNIDPLVTRSRIRNESGVPGEVLNSIANGSNIDAAYLSAAQKLPDIRKQNTLNQIKSDVSNAPISQYWHKSLLNKVNDEIDSLGIYHRVSRRDIDEPAMAATLEAISREAKKRGMKVDYVSAKSSHAGGSQYIEAPDGRIVRISDHELPDTPQREYNRSIGLTGRWNDEILLNDWRNTSMDDYINRIINGPTD